MVVGFWGLCLDIADCFISGAGLGDDWLLNVGASVGVSWFLDVGTRQGVNWLLDVGSWAWT